MPSEDANDHPADVKAAKTPGRKRLSTLLRVGLSVATIVILMLWILGTFRRGVIPASKQPVPVESAVGLTTQKIAMQTIPAVSCWPAAIRISTMFATTREVTAATCSAWTVPTASGEGAADDCVRQAHLGFPHGGRSPTTNATSPSFDQQVITAYDFEHTETNLKTGNQRRNTGGAGRPRSAAPGRAGAGCRTQRGSHRGLESRS
jgi:hypothetical protein